MTAGGGGTSQPIDLSIFFGLPTGSLLEDLFAFGRRPAAAYVVTGGFSVSNGAIEGNIEGTLDGSAEAGTFSGTLFTRIGACIAQRRYSGPLTASALNWAAGAHVNACGGTSPLTFGLAVPSAPPGTPPSIGTTIPTTVISSTTTVGSTTTTVRVTTSSTTTSSSTTVPVTTPSTITSSSTTTTIPVNVTVTSPADVAYSGVPIGGSGCVGRPHTWFYSESLNNTTTQGISIITLTRVVDTFDGVTIADKMPNALINPGSSYYWNYQWCSSADGPHTIETTYTWRDANARVDSRVVVHTLLPPYDDFRQPLLRRPGHPSAPD